MSPAEELPNGEIERLRRQIASYVGTSIDDRDLGALARLMASVEPVALEPTLRSAAEELARLSREAHLEGDPWTSGYLAACQARVSLARDLRRFLDLDEEARRAEIERAIDGAVLVALAHARGLTMTDLAERTVMDVDDVTAAVWRWERLGHVVVQMDADGTVVARLASGGSVA